MNIEIDNGSILAGNHNKWAFLAVKRAARGPWRRFKRAGRGFTHWDFSLGWVQVYFCTLEFWGHRTRKWKRRLRELQLILNPRPVYVEFSSFCCDTGNFSWADRFSCGFRAWQHTRPEALDGGDGPTYFHIIKDQHTIDYYFPPPCRHVYPDEMSSYCGAHICVHCGHHKGLARCYCGWTSRPGENVVGEFAANGEMI